MVIVFKPGAPEENKAKMRSNLESKGFQINEINGVNMTIFGIIGDTSTLDINMLRIDDAVDKVMRVQEPFKRANRMFHPQDSVINVGGVEIGGRKIQVIRRSVLREKRRSRLRTLPNLSSWAVPRCFAVAPSSPAHRRIPSKA